MEKIVNSTVISLYQQDSHVLPNLPLLRVKGTTLSRAGTGMGI